MSTQKWALDPTHSEIQFKVKHLMITTVTGSFKSFDASAETDGEDFSTAKVSFQAEVASISTGNEQRDEHLKSPDFFDAASNPHVSFESTQMVKNSEEEYTLKGNLTMHGITQPIEFKVEAGGIAKDPWGNTKAGFTLSGKVNRKDFGLTWNVATEAGGVLVSEEVKLLAEVQFAKQ
jgi:polyisoprenoid-binding protein YceI